jgi:hypothetical protein
MNDIFSTAQPVHILRLYLPRLAVAGPRVGRLRQGAKPMRVFPLRSRILPP